MISVGVAQTRNSTELNQNFQAITRFLTRFEKAKVDVGVFPECSLSGCSAKMKSCTKELLSEHLRSIQSWVNDTGIHVVLPTAIVKGNKVYNSVFWMSREGRKQFFKTGLTPSERKFFSLPDEAPRKLIRIGETRCAVLLCREAQDEPFTHFSRDEADLILWPGYWGWTKDDDWTESLASGELNSVLENMKSWKLPLIQSNFAFNDLAGYSGPGPAGLSVVVNADNELVYRAPFAKESGFVVQLRKTSSGLAIERCEDLPLEP